MEEKLTNEMVVTEEKTKKPVKKLLFIVVSIAVIVALCVGFFVYTQVIVPQKSIDKVNSMIASLTEKETLLQSEVEELTTAYENLGDKEKDGIDKAAYEKAIELRPIEKAAVSVAHEIKGVMRSSDSFKVLEDVKVKKAEGLFSYYVLIEYSGQNGFGGTNDHMSCLGVTDTYSPLSLELSYLTGRTENVLKSTETYALYTKSKDTEYTIDANRVMANIDLEVQE